MSKDTCNEALDNIHDIIVSVLARDDIPTDIRNDLRIAEALARHRDLSGFLTARDADRLTEIKRANNTADYGEEERR